MSEKTERTDETMLLYPAMKDLLKNVPSRYLLVNLVAARARKISSLAEQEGLPLEEKPVTMAIQEVAEGILRPETAQIAGQDEGNEGPDGALEGDEQASE
ncbi:MAG TPA: DNA-directed RNA polymerase subunit omega [Firmicutes bacterium]|nr:DNA-directed RNA polymerase subunit omega [Bacillota bacterium]